jgi:hypothetical protein
MPTTSVRRLISLLTRSSRLVECSLARCGAAAHAHRPDQIVYRARGNALHIGFLDDCGERLLGHPPRLQKAREVGALAQLGNAQLNRAGAGLPGPVTVAVALHQALGALLAVTGAGEGADLQLHQPFGGKADHLTQQVGVRVFSTSARRFIISSVIGGSSNQVGCRNPTLPTNHRWPQRSRPPATALCGARVRAASLPPSYTTNWDATYRRGAWSFALWLLGYPEAALVDLDLALRDARKIGHANDLLYA